MKRLFTAGPWEARTFMIMGGNRMLDRICHVGTSTSLGPPRSHETEANARLMAASPELLAALDAFMEAADPAMLVERDHPHAVFRDVRLLAESAIIKAVRAKS